MNWQKTKQTKHELYITYANVLDHGDKNSPKNNTFQVLIPLHFFLKQTMVFRLLLKALFINKTISSENLT